MVDVIPYGNFNGEGKSKRKKQIILCHTSREVGEYLTSLKFRHYGKYDKIPHYIIGRDGKIFQLLESKSISNFFSFSTMKRDGLIVCLENLGWLNKKPLSSHYVNWLGNIYKEEIYEKKWRDYNFWQPYTDEQIKSTASLCRMLCEELVIPKKFVGHNVKVDGVDLFHGIATRSNYHHRFTDLSPAFNFEDFRKQLDYEQLHEREV